MAERSFKLKLISANGLNKLTRVSKMDVYAVAYITGGTVNQDQKQRTYVDKGGDSNPIWNCSMKFTIDEYAALKNRSTLVVKIIMEAKLGDKTVGQVHVPIKGLLEGYSPGGKSLRFVSYQVTKPSGKLKGELSFSYKFGASKLGKPAAKPDKADKLVIPCNHVGTYNKLQEPVTGYRSTSLYPSVYEASVDATPEFYQPPAPPTAVTPKFYQPPAPTAAVPGSYQPPAPAAATPGFYQPLAPAAAEPGFYQPPAPATATTGFYQPPAPAAAATEFYQQPAPPAIASGFYQPPVPAASGFHQPPAQTVVAPEFHQPPALTFAASGFYQPPAPAVVAPGFYQPPAPTAAAPGYFPLAGGANYTPLGYPQPQAGYTYQQQSGYGTWYHGYPLKQSGYNVNTQQQSSYGGYSQPPVYNGYLPQQSSYSGNRWCSRQASYGGNPSPPGGHCGYPSITANGYPPVQNKKHKLGLGFGVWLLAVVGGLVLGRILSNAAAFGG